MNDDLKMTQNKKETRRKPRKKLEKDKTLVRENGFKGTFYEFIAYGVNESRIQNRRS